MPIIRSAKKKLRQAVKKARRNRVLKRRLKDILKKVREKPTKENVTTAQSIIDRTQKVGVIHKNKASRLKSRIQKLLPKTVPKTASRAKKTPRIKKTTPPKKIRATKRKKA